MKRLILILMVLTSLSLYADTMTDSYEPHGDYSLNYTEEQLSLIDDVPPSNCWCLDTSGELPTFFHFYASAQAKCCRKETTTTSCTYRGNACP